MERTPQNRRSTIERVVGVPRTTEEELRDIFAQHFHQQEWDIPERPFPEELETLVQGFNSKMEEFLGEYGIASIEIPPQNIHLVDTDALPPEKQPPRTAEEEVLGVFLPQKQGVAVLQEYAPGHKAHFSQILVHEMLHANAFNSLEKTTPDAPSAILELEKDGSTEKLVLGTRRAGFAVNTRQGELLFQYIDEAVIEELTKRFDERYFAAFPEIANEVKRRNRIREAIATESEEDLERIKYRVAHITDIEKTSEQRASVTFAPYSYLKSIDQLNALVDDLFEQNRAAFESREDVFALFVHATMLGRLLPVARLIEKTYGKGSFRGLGKQTENKYA